MLDYLTQKETKAAYDIPIRATLEGKCVRSFQSLEADLYVTS